MASAAVEIDETAVLLLRQSGFCMIEVNELKKVDEDHCVCEELGEADGKAYKIKYINVLTVDGQEPNELAAVYGLGPKTARFKRKNTE